MQLVPISEGVPEFTLLVHVLRGNMQWEDENFPENKLLIYL